MCIEICSSELNKQLIKSYVLDRQIVQDNVLISDRNFMSCTVNFIAFLWIRLYLKSFYYRPYTPVSLAPIFCVLVHHYNRTNRAELKPPEYYYDCYICNLTNKNLIWYLCRQLFLVRFVNSCRKKILIKAWNICDWFSTTSDNWF